MLYNFILFILCLIPPLGYEWIGWRNDTLAGRPVEITFEFETVRNFSAVIIHTNNMFSKDVQVSVLGSLREPKGT